MAAADTDRPLVAAALERALTRLLEEYGAPLVPELKAAGMRCYDAAFSGRNPGPQPQHRSLRATLGLPDDAGDEAVIEAGASELMRELERLGRGLGVAGNERPAPGGGSLDPLGARFTLRNVVEKLQKLCSNFDEKVIQTKWKDALAYKPKPEELPTGFLPTVGTGKAPADFGNLVHRHYQERYREHFATRRLVIERTQFLSADEVGAADEPKDALFRHRNDVPYTDLRVLHELLTSPLGYPARADLIDLVSREAWEIKTVKALPEGVAQIAHLTLGFECLASTHGLKPAESTLKPGGMWPPDLTTPYTYYDPANPRYISMAMPMSTGLWPGLFVYEVARLDASKVAAGAYVGLTALDRLKRLWEDRTKKRKAELDGVPQGGGALAKTREESSGEGHPTGWTARVGPSRVTCLYAIAGAAVLIVLVLAPVPPIAKAVVAAAALLLTSPEAGAAVPHTLGPAKIAPRIHDALAQVTAHPVAMGGRLYREPDVAAFADLMWSRMQGWLQAALDDRQPALPAMGN